MTWVKGQSGNPAGRVQDKEWREALRKAVKRAAADGTGKLLDQLARKTIAEGLSGNMAAVKEIGDRLDGKADSAVNVHHSGGIAVEHFGLPETASFVTEALGERAERPPPKPVLN